jgi:hypothetical protein
MKNATGGEIIKPLDKETTKRLLKDHVCEWCKFVDMKTLLQDPWTYRVICQWTGKKLPESHSCEKFQKAIEQSSLWHISNGR